VFSRKSRREETPLPEIPPPFDVPASVASGLGETGARPGPQPFSVIRPRCGLEPDAPTDEIVVCARDEEQFRLRPLPELPDSPPASIGIGENARISGRVEGVTIGGVPSNRIMIDLKLKF
jgi:hypothetical protein